MYAKEVLAADVSIDEMSVQGTNTGQLHEKNRVPSQPDSTKGEALVVIEDMNDLQGQDIAGAGDQVRNMTGTSISLLIGNIN